MNTPKPTLHPSQRDPSSSANAPSSSKTSAQPGEMVAAGVVLDTHHPERPGRVLVRWLSRDAKTHQAWLETNVTLSFEPGVQVMLLRSSTWHEWVVAFPFGEGALSKQMQNPRGATKDEVLRLEPTQGVQVQGAQGKELFRIAQNEQGDAVLEMPGDLCMETQGVFRLKAERLELRSGQGGTDARSDGETVVRGTKIHLN